LGEEEERGYLGGGGEGEGCCVCYGCAQGFGVVFDFVFLFVEFVFAEEVVYGFVVLLLLAVSLWRGGREGVAYDLEELTLHFIFPSFRLELIGDSKHLLNSPGNHPRRLFSLSKTYNQYLRDRTN
jgi:hypothetical protein